MNAVIRKPFRSYICKSPKSPTEDTSVIAMVESNIPGVLRHAANIRLCLIFKLNRNNKCSL